MNRNDLESLKYFIDQALSRGWHPCITGEQGTFIVLDPPCVHVTASPAPAPSIDTSVYVDWLAPLSDMTLAKAAWGSRLVSDATYGYQENWRFQQHKLLDFLQTAPKEVYFEYLTESVK